MRRRRIFESTSVRKGPYYAPNPLRGGAPKGWSKVRGCERPGEVIESVDVAIRDFVVGDRGGGGLGARFTDF